LFASRNISLLNSAKKYAKNLKSIAITGSINSITTGDDLATRTLTNTSWNNITQAQAKEMNNPYISYCSSKKEAELAVWEFVKNENPSFGITVFLPALIFGPPIQPVKSVANLNFSVSLLYSLFNGQNTTIPATPFPSYIDVRDLADAHVKALTTEGAKNKRFLIGGKLFGMEKVVEVLKGIKALEGRLPAANAEAEVLPEAKIGAEEGNEVLGMKFRSFEETIGDTVERILEIEKSG
jgi:nucleoside-diphosphate-sugar epimerase